MDQINNITISLTSNQAEGLRVDLQIRHLWQHQTNTIIDVRVMGTYVKSYLYRPLEYILETQET